MVRPRYLPLLLLLFSCQEGKQQKLITPVPFSQVQIQDGPLMATLDVPDTGWKWKERKVPVQVDVNPKETIYLVGAKAPFSVKSFRFNR